MANAQGSNLQLGFKQESTWGTAPGSSGGVLLPRGKWDGQLNKDILKADDIVSTYQQVDLRHGTRRAKATLSRKLAPGVYAPFIGGLLMQDFASVSAISGLSLTIATSGSNYTITRATGSFISDGVKVFDVIRLTGGSLNAANVSKNIFVLSLTATVITGFVLNGLSLTAEGPISSCTVTVTGKKSMIPQSGQVSRSFYLDAWYNDVSRGEQFSGMRCTGANFGDPSNGLADVSLTFMGKDRIISNSQYFSSPTAASTAGFLSPANGVLLLNGSQIAVVTSLSTAIQADAETPSVVGSTNGPDTFTGMRGVTGSFSLIFVDGAASTLFDAETEFALGYVSTTSAAANADFVVKKLPCLKVTSETTADAQKQIVKTFNFEAKNNPPSNYDSTIFCMQDSLA